jgi:TRAP-type C4-dicarboxylate transport system permease small subunit
VKVFAYYYVITTVLSRLGLGVDILETLFNTVVVSVFGALGVGIALAIAIGLGWGSKDYVAENIDDWMSSARDSASDITDEGSSGSSDEFESPGSTDD